MSPDRIREQYERIRTEVGRGVTVVAATKYVSIEDMAALAEAGIEVVGENRAQALEAKHAVYGDAFRWHFIGHLQRGIDQGEASVYLFKNGMLVGEGHYYQATTVSSYTPFEAKVIYDPTFTGVPDSATVVFITSKDPNNATGACVLYIDNIQLNKFSLGIDKQNEAVKTVYPNPFTDQLNITLKNDEGVVTLFNVEGKVVMTQNINKNNSELNTTNLATGLYIVRIIDGEQITIQKAIKN